VLFVYRRGNIMPPCMDMCILERLFVNSSSCARRARERRGVLNEKELDACFRVTRVYSKRFENPEMSSLFMADCKPRVNLVIYQQFNPLNGKKWGLSLGTYYILVVPDLELNGSIFNFFTRAVLTTHRTCCKLPQILHCSRIMSKQRWWNPQKLYPRIALFELYPEMQYFFKSTIVFFR
jgi:hypothetical protein